jgi:hypothetical protein
MRSHSWPTLDLLHPGEHGGLLGAIEEHHQHHPLQALEIELVAVEGHDPLDDPFPGGDVEDVRLLEELEEPPAARIEAGLLVACVHPDRGQPAARGRGYDLLSALVDESVEPGEGALDLVTLEAGADERLPDSVPIGVRGRIVVDAALEHVHQDVHQVAAHTSVPLSERE